ncbi:MAG: hypothetical protein R8K21_07890 [Mariprofundales bacterium]
MMNAQFSITIDKDFFSEREWVCLRLIGHTAKTLADADAAHVCTATAQQVPFKRAKEIIDIAHLRKYSGIGTWFGRLAVEAGLDAKSIYELSAANIAVRINTSVGYPIITPSIQQALLTWQTNKAIQEEKNK